MDDKEYLEKWWLECRNGLSRSAIAELWSRAQESERQACVAAIDAANDCECGIPCDCFGAGAAKWVIMERSNAKDELS